MPSRDFWADLYKSLPAAAPPWDLGRVAPPIARIAGEGVVAPGARVLVPGCGLGHEAIHLARAGFTVTAMDLTEDAIRLGAEAASRAGVRCAWEVGDFLAPDPSTELRTGGRTWDAICEHALFCAVEPSEREGYVAAAAARLVPGGALFGLFYAHQREGGPPYATREDEVRRLFSPQFAIERLRRAPDSIDRRAGEELEAVLRRRP